MMAARPASDIQRRILDRIRASRPEARATIAPTPNSHARDSTEKYDIGASVASKYCEM